MSDKCKRCGACQHCGSAPSYPVYYPAFYPAWWSSVGPQQVTPRQGYGYVGGNAGYNNPVAGNTLQPSAGSASA